MIKANRLRAAQATAHVPGAVGVIELVGCDDAFFASLGGGRRLDVGRQSLVQVGDIDECVVARVTSEYALLMPHGGPRVMQRMLQHLESLGVEIAESAQVDPWSSYPEAEDRYEAIMFDAMSRATSPMAVDLLLDQPRRWRAKPTLTDEDRSRSVRLNRLLRPPRVVLAGDANVGKSTLSNRLLGRTMSIEADQPGTTRDYVAAQIDLAGLVVIWHDTPGIRADADPLEREALHVANRLIDHADLLVALTDDAMRWPRLLREPDLLVVNKVDRLALRPKAPVLGVSARTGEGIEELVRTVVESLVPKRDRNHAGPWLFDDRLLAG